MNYVQRPGLLSSRQSLGPFTVDVRTMYSGSRGTLSVVVEAARIAWIVWSLAGVSVPVATGRQMLLHDM